MKFPRATAYYKGSEIGSALCQVPKDQQLSKHFEEFCDKHFEVELNQIKSET